jgi:hypothetical protein
VTSDGESAAEHSSQIDWIGWSMSVWIARLLLCVVDSDSCVLEP